MVGNQLFVSDRGGRTAQAGDTTDTSDGTPIVVKPSTAVPASGTVSVVDAATDTVTNTINVGIEPTNITDHDGYLFVTNTNSDTVSIIDAATQKVVQTFSVNPLPGTKVGAYPNDVTFVSSTQFLVSVKSANAVAEFGYSGPGTPVRYEGLIPADWFPNQVTYDPTVGKVIVSNQQGVGTDGYEQTYKVLGTLTSFTPPTNLQLGALTRDVFTDNAWNNIPAEDKYTESSDRGKLPAIPAELGQPSAIKHVFLLIKENRSYDQVLGDLGEGNGDDSGTIVRTISPATPFDAWHSLFIEPGGPGPLIQGAVTSIIWAVIFGVAALMLLRRRGFASSDTNPRLQRHATIRLAVIAVVGGVVLLGAAGLGPTNLTAQRLQASIGPTFARLSAVRYLWQTGTPGEANVTMTATCNRGDGTQKSSGAGDDWACVVVDSNPADDGQPVTFDVALKPNGCYTAEAGSAFGPLLINNEQGKAFINPVYAFDGCFGTP